ncbi:FHL3 [Branchiostoma lanceolatum]|uniref:FHL3 protein n=1 Tax=Branchiostoma lanceolatum TaxID=7740 RepID=A0A8J9W1L2_BRALA|nr:FHL3 [Branchiostoma lanceolatum]
MECHQCRRPLAGHPYDSHEGNVYCSDCFSTFHAKKCAVCFMLLDTSSAEKFTTYDGKSFHGGCFACSVCNTPLSGEKFTVNGDDKVCGKCN